MSFLFRHMVMYILHLKVNGSSIAALTHSDCDQAMKECEFSEKGKTDTKLNAPAGINTLRVNLLFDQKKTNFLRVQR